MCKAPGIVAMFIGSLRYNTTLAFTGTPVAPFPGRWLSTDGFVKSRPGPVANWLSNSGSALPERSVTFLVPTTVTVLDAGHVPTSNVTAQVSAEQLTEGLRFVPLASNAKGVKLAVFAFSDVEEVSTTVE